MQISRNARLAALVFASFSMVMVLACRPKSSNSDTKNAVTSTATSSSNGGTHCEKDVNGVKQVGKTKEECDKINGNIALPSAQLPVPGAPVANTPAPNSVMVGGHTCEKQKEWGKCNEGWMKPVCDHVCNATTATATANGGNFARHCVKSSNINGQQIKQEGHTDEECKKLGM